MSKDWWLMVILNCAIMRWNTYLSGIWFTGFTQIKIPLSGYLPPLNSFWADLQAEDKLINMKRHTCILSILPHPNATSYSMLWPVQVTTPPHSTESPPERLVMRRPFGTLWRTNEGGFIHTRTHAEEVAWTESVLSFAGEFLKSERTCLLLGVSCTR